MAVVALSVTRQFVIIIMIIIIHAGPVVISPLASFGFQADLLN
jgi:hypothetical protein